MLGKIGLMNVALAMGMLNGAASQASVKLRVQADAWPAFRPEDNRDRDRRRYDSKSAAQRRRDYRATDRYGRPINQSGDKLARKARKGAVGNHGHLK